MEAIADHLMSQCKNGNADAGGSRSKKRKWDTVKGTAGQWFDKGFKGDSKCFNRTNEKILCEGDACGVCGCNNRKVGEKGGFTRTRILQQMLFVPGIPRKGIIVCGYEIEKKWIAEPHVYSRKLDFYRLVAGWGAVG